MLSKPKSVPWVIRKGVKTQENRDDNDNDKKTIIVIYYPIYD